jgi:hypothetical protein
MPKAQVDLIGGSRAEILLAGISKLHAVNVTPTARGNFLWSWYNTDWGQHVLVKHRQNLRDLAESLLLTPPRPPGGVAASTSRRSTQQPTEPERDTPLDKPRRDRSNVSLDSVVLYLESQQFSDAAIAYTVRRMAASASERDFASVSRALYKALRARQ